MGQLKEAGYKTRSIKEELRANLIAKLKKKETAFEGIWGYEETVIPDVERAILAGHAINFLGLQERTSGIGDAVNAAVLVVPIRITL